jgi:hypothetical protein
MSYKSKGKCVHKKDTGVKVGCTKRDVNLFENINEPMLKSLNSEKIFDINFSGLPSKNGDKISIIGKSMADVYELYNRLHNWLENNNIAHKIATKKRVTNNNYEQSKKLVTIYVPDNIDIKKLLIKIEYLLKGYTGWNNIKTPFNGYEHYSNGIYFRNDRNEYGEYIPTSQIRETNNMENKIKGGKADKMSVKDIADKFGVTVAQINKELNMGKKIEHEHTTNMSKAIEIAMDHLSEFPDYYTRLAKMEKEAEKHAKTLQVNEDTKPLIKRLIRENLFKNKKKSIITESLVTGKTIINVDIQPEYQDYITFDVNEWVRFINKSTKTNKIIFLFNGEDTLGMISQHDYYYWLNKLGIKSSVLDNAIFYDKGYAFFRYCMDNSIDEQNIADFVRFMIKHDINDSREMDEHMWYAFMEETNHTLSDVKELLENSDDMINIPDLVDFIQNYDNIVLTGGGVNECLKEVEIALLAIDKPFNVLHEFTY